MYIHQVIEDFNKCVITDQWVINKNDILDCLKNSVCFHIGELLDLIIKSKLDINVPDVERNVFNPPYKTIWIDCKQDIVDPETGYKSFKTGCLIDTDINMDFIVYSFFYIKQLNTWWINPMGFVVKIQDKDTVSYHQIRYYKVVEEDDGQYRINSIISLLMARMLFLFLNTKNIYTVDNEPPLKLNKKRIKNNKMPLVTYKTLVVKPTGKKQINQEAKGLWDNRLHLCRGHFKTYTEENPLFGKITGRYWWQSTIKGNKNKGIVIKDYKIETK